MQRFVIAIHGGAGDDPVTGMTPVLKEAYHHALGKIVDEGYEMLRKGGNALDAVEHVMRLLEDCPLFNAGRGAAFTETGTHEMDAAMMCGRRLRAGSVASISSVKNPICLARKVLENTKHVMLVGKGAEMFAKEMNIELMPDDYFYTEHKYVQWTREKEQQGTPGNINEHGTAGAVALDMNGDLAAATSTGGLTNKKPGRVGDSPIIGAGTYASNDSCAVSCSGDGEFMMRTVAAHEVASLLRYRDYPIAQACEEVVFRRLDPFGGDAAIMGLDRNGNFHYSFNTKRFYRGWKSSDGNCGTAIYRDS
jgi:beta-aspartyl-peptidase (threonine type)